MTRTHSTVRRNFLVPALATALLLVTAVFIWLLIGQMNPEQAVNSGDSDEVVLAQSESGDEQELAEDSATAEAMALEVTYDTFLARDPFESIMPPEPVAADDPMDPSDPSDPAGPSGPATPGDPTDPSHPGGKDPDDGCRTGSEAVCDGTVLVVTATSPDYATIEVNGTPFIVAPGQRFAGRFTLLQIDGDCVEFLYMNGDQAQVVSQCIGDVTVK